MHPAILADRRPASGHGGVALELLGGAGGRIADLDVEGDLPGARVKLPHRQVIGRA
jgi:hypothetical protein